MPTNEQVIEALTRVYDTEMPVNIVDLGLIYNVDVEGDVVNVSMTLTSPSNGMGQLLTRDAQQQLEALPGVREVNISVTFDPPWSKERMSEAGVRMLCGSQPL